MKGHQNMWRQTLRLRGGPLLLQPRGAVVVPRRDGRGVPTLVRVVLLCAVALLTLLPIANAYASSVTWTRQFGTSRLDSATDIDVHSTGVYVAGHTTGALPGQTNQGSDDAFLRKYNSAGGIVWTRQFGSSGSDKGHSVAVDSTGIYVVGQAYGRLPGQTNQGNVDAFVRKYNLNGGHVWTRQFGSSNIDIAWDIDVDSTGLYIAGHTAGTLSGQSKKGWDDAFVRKYSFTGSAIWTH